MNENGCDFSLGDDVCQTIKNALSAIVHDFVDGGDKPDLDAVVQDVEDFIGGMPAMHRGGLTWMFKGLEMAPLAMGYRSKFSNLEREEQVDVLDRFEKSDNYVQRGTILGLKNVLVMIYFGRPEIEKILGYDHKCLTDLG